MIGVRMCRVCMAGTRFNKPHIHSINNAVFSSFSNLPCHTITFSRCFARAMIEVCRCSCSLSLTFMEFNSGAAPVKSPSSIVAGNNADSSFILFKSSIMLLAFLIDDHRKAEAVCDQIS